MKSPAPGEVMGIDDLLNEKGGQHQQQQQQFHQQHQHQQHHQQHQFLPPVSLPGMQPMTMQPYPSHHSLERADSPHGSDHSRFSSAAPGSLNGLDTSVGKPFGSPTAMHNSPLHMPDLGSTPNSSNGLILPSLPPTLAPNLGPTLVLPPHGIQYTKIPMASGQPPKAYPCSTCGKGFARRSDLARHERIHTGVRPHVCDFPGCGKQFIQRSALTVHRRVHTGEKPHQCERCGKPFGDSSSLARHRRIHTGKRPYRCPYADCQKTFTRRTTLTRHQNHHTGTIEDAARATAAVLARGASNQMGRLASRPPRSDGFSNAGSDHAGSPLSTPSPGQRTMSLSPASELAAINQQIQQHSQHPFSLPNSSSLPVHLRNDLQSSGMASPVSTTSSLGLGGTGGNGGNGGGSVTGGYASMRPTSHPTGYGPPSTLEPSIEPSSGGGGPGSVGGGSPHMGSLSGWQSPSSHHHGGAHNNGGNSPASHHLAASPAHSHSNYVYPDPDPTYGQLFYATSAPSTNANGTVTSAPGMGHHGHQVGRPGSSEPPAGAFDVSKQPRQSELWAIAQ